jgi:hypothetical protein
VHYGSHFGKVPIKFAKSISEIALVGAGKKNGARPESESSPFLSCILFFACGRRGWDRQAGTLLSVQRRCLGVMMNCTLTITMS